MQEGKKAKRRSSIMLTMETATKERLQLLARQHHMTCSQYVTTFVWRQRLKSEYDRDEAK